jgi:GT2 family glycosyltransferase
VISIIAVTHNRAHLLRLCVERVLGRTSSLTTEIVIWDNASTDGTREYLDSLGDPRVRVVHHPENIAMNARARAFRLVQGEYLIELDDDVVEAPPNWDETLLNAYRRLPQIGRLAANLAYDPNDVASRYLRYMREERGAYPLREVNGVRILDGSPGGACTMTSRELYERVGGYREHGRLPYWRPEIPYEKAMRKLGYRSALLAELEVRHAGGGHYSEIPQAKVDYHAYELKLRGRKDAVKRLLLRIPLAAALNARFRWIDPPAPQYDPATYDPGRPGEEPRDRSPAR